MWSLTHELVYQYLKDGSAKNMKDTVFMCLNNLRSENLLSIRNNKSFRKHKGSEGNLIYFALQYKNQDLFNTLIQKCYSFNLSFEHSCYINGDSVLHAAVRHGVIHYFYYNYYLGPFNKYVNLRNDNDETPLHVACQVGNKQAIKYILRCYSYVDHLEECFKYCIENDKYHLVDYIFKKYSHNFSERDFQRYLSYVNCEYMKQFILKHNPYW